MTLVRSQPAAWLARRALSRSSAEPRLTQRSVRTEGLPTRNAGIRVRPRSGGPLLDQKRPKKRVGTLCTPVALDSVVHASDWSGLGEVFGGLTDFQGEAPVSSPTSGTVFPLFRGL
jgi:hypothetical protein